MAKNIDIPNGWEVKKLGEVVNINNSSLKENTDPNYAFTYIDLSSVNQGKIDIPIEQIYFKEAPSRARRLIEINNIIISTVRPNLQGFAYIDFTCKDYIVSTGFAVLSYKCNINMKFLYNMFYSNILMKQINAIITGSNYPAISSADIKNFIIPVPPLAEQEKIAEILSLWDKAIEQTKELIAYKEKQKKGLMQNLLTGKKRLSGFTDEWKTTKLGEICKITTGKLDANAMEENGIYPFFTCAKDVYRINTFAFDTEALLISGNGANVGYIHYYMGKFNAYQRTYVLNNFKEYIIFLKYYLENYLHIRIDKEKKAGNTPYITLDTISNMNLYIPQYQNEQKAIADILCKADEEIELLKKQLDLYMEQKKGLMQNLLTGKVRVKV